MENRRHAGVHYHRRHAVEYARCKTQRRAGLPLFVDDIGTVLAAVLGGYIPCITVGFLSNIIGGLSDSYTTYYCIISVLIAVAAVSYAEKMRRIKIPAILLAILTFAVLGGIVGGLLTWLINGLSFGEAFARGEKFDKLAEGYYTVDALVRLGKKHNVELPICEAVYAVLYENADPAATIEGLFTRALKNELN